jgi:hypothetical protein
MTENCEKMVTKSAWARSRTYDMCLRSPMLYLGTIMLTYETECNARIGNHSSGLFLVVKIIFFCFFLVYCNAIFSRTTTSTDFFVLSF